MLVVGIGAADVPFTLFFRLHGRLAGVTFSGILRILRPAEVRGKVAFGLCRVGALGGLLISGIVVVAAGPAGEFLVLGPVFALAGAISSAGSPAGARRTEARELPDANAEVPNV